MTLFRRFAVLQLLLLWQGGFLFYALVVVPIGSDVLGNATEQGFITRRVSVWINYFGLACLLAFLLDSLYTAPLKSIRVFFTWLAAVLQLALFVIHPRLDRLLDVENHTINDGPAFYRLHAIYLIISGLLWLAMLLNALLMLIAWRDVGRRIHNMHTFSEPPR